MQRLYRDENRKLSVQIYCDLCSEVIGSKPIHEVRNELVLIEYRSGWLSEEDVKSIGFAKYYHGVMATPYYPV
jgi:hypothetical protein